MEKNGAAKKSPSYAVGPFRHRRLTAEDIATGRHPLGPAEAQAQAGMKYGQHVVTCDSCRGAGYLRFGTRPIDDCHKCHGEGTLVIQESYPSPKPQQVGWKVAVFLIFVCLFGLVYIFCWQ